MIKDITAVELENLLKEDKKVFVDFHAVWCGPCKMVEPVIKDLSESYTDKVEYVKINVDEEPDAAAKYGVRSVPTFLLLDKNSILFKHSGASPKSFFEEKIKRLI